MTTEVISYKPYGLRECIRTKKEVHGLAEFIGEFRGLFEDRVDAIAVIKDGVATALILAEPDIDCDQDGYYEVAPQYLGQEYNCYGPTSKTFWNRFTYYFSPNYIATNGGAN